MTDKLDVVSVHYKGAGHQADIFTPQFLQGSVGDDSSLNGGNDDQKCHNRDEDDPPDGVCRTHGSVSGRGVPVRALGTL